MPRKAELTAEDQALRERFGIAIRAASAAAGVKPQDIARIGGVSLANQYRIEAGDATPDALYLFKVARHLNLSMDALLSASLASGKGAGIVQSNSGHGAVQIAGAAKGVAFKTRAG